MPVFLKHLVVQGQNEKSNEKAFESMCVLALSQGEPSVLVSGLIFKSKPFMKTHINWKPVHLHCNCVYV